MRSHTDSSSNRVARHRAGLVRVLADSQAGFTIIEVVVSALIVASIAGAAATALIATTRTSGDQRDRSLADSVAQQDQERLRAMSIGQLAGRNETRTVGPYNGTTYTVTSTGKFLSSTGASSCSSSGVGAAAFVLIRSEVDWPGNWVNNQMGGTRRRPAVVQESLITPPTGGTLLTNVKDETNTPLAGVTVTATGPDSASAVTDAEGCTVFGGLASGDYQVGVTKSGYVDPEGNPSGSIPLRPATVSGSGTSFPTPNPFKLGQGGTISPFFKTQIGAGNWYGDQKAPSVSWVHPGMAVSKANLVAASGSPPKVIPEPFVNIFNAYPYSFTNGTGTYTDNYTVWAGSCDFAKPPTANQSKATLTPGGWAILNDGVNLQPRVQMPGLIIKVNADGAPVTPSNIRLRHNGCGQTFWPAVRPGDPLSPLGQLQYPGQPYAPDISGQKYTVCVDYDPPGGPTTYFRTTMSGIPNNDFVNGVTRTLNIDTGVSSGAC